MSIVVDGDAPVLVGDGGGVVRGVADVGGGTYCALAHSALLTALLSLLPVVWLANAAGTVVVQRTVADMHDAVVALLKHHCTRSVGHHINTHAGSLSPDIHQIYYQ
jgi:hypothetical protein